MKGWVYIIKNKSMPSLIKIGFTNKDPDERAKELSNTGNPFPYEVVYEALVNQPYNIEQKTHKKLKDYKEGKEWFACSISIGIKAIEEIAGNNILYKTNKVSQETNGFVLKLDQKHLDLKGLKKHMRYSEARKIILKAGWQGIKKSRQDVSYYGQAKNIYFENKWYEVQDCTCCGLALCRFEFHDLYKNILVVITVGECSSKEICDPLVSNWFFENGQSYYLNSEYN